MVIELNIEVNFFVLLVYGNTFIFLIESEACSELSEKS